MASPRVSVIVPMYNASGTIRSCLESLSAVDYPDLEIIVVDDASRDGSADIARRLGCSLVSMKRNSGPGAARNEGVRHSSGELLAFTDSDCEVPRDWVRKLLAYFTRDDIAAVSGGYSASASSGFVALFQFYDTSFRQRCVPQYINGCITANFACRKKDFEKAGGFPEIRINEDMEFGEALSRHSRILWAKDNGVRHHFENNFRKYFVEQIKWAESVVRLYLASPKTLFGKSTWNNGEISCHLAFSGLLYAALLGIPFFRFSEGAFIFIFFCYLVANLPFIRFVSGREGPMKGMGAFFFLIVRNTAWMLGILKALLPKSGKRSL